MQKSEGKYILALEAAIDGGSVSILSDEVEIDFVKGNQNLSKSEDLLTLLDDLLSRNKIKKHQIKLIAVSTGAGSLTGLRIGKAIALGLGNSLNITVLEIPLFEALNQNIIAAKNSISAIYGGGDKVLFQENSIENNKPAEIKSIALKEFAQKYNNWKMLENTAIIFSENLRLNMTVEEWNKISNDQQIQIVGGNLSNIIGFKANAMIASDNEEN